ncbi:hypothetical protein H2200_001470 [Cladophialophora chaetospira]|uniref:Ubiquitin-conjugating enzyme E2C-binding protein n=1 Tax=Cladophialophora chaetospira TaxID=386627 RepID=A0AA38XLQ5_9EURO|nr:hypothetical protein H2200_001470 [Cladophialophora chaetospira]
MPKPKIVLYAEALTNIRQLTLHASLQTEKNEHTKILISSDKKIITALHDGEAASIYLPTQISGTAHVTFPIEKRTEISTRLQIDDTGLLEALKEDSSGVEYPWSAVSLRENSSLSCSQCEACVLSAGKAVSWKDLPSEHWAELMDLWFCHKPHGHGDSSDEHAAKTKGFSAQSKVVPSPGIGLVDTVSFLLAPQDCTNIEETEEFSRAGIVGLQCGSCKTRLGSKVEGEESYRIYKSRLAVALEPGQDSEQYSAAIFLAAQLLSLIENSATRKVVVHTGSPGEPESEEDGLLLWIFNPDIYYSSSKRGPTAYRAMKVFYQSLSGPERFLDGHGSSHEELLVPKEDFVDFRNTLEQSTDILPDSARSFQDWHVGLLDRWEKTATGSARMDENPLNKKVDEGFETFQLPAGMQELYL